MPGSMRERQPNVWELRVFLGRDDNGKVRHANQMFRGGKRMAERELSRLVAAAGNEPVPPPVVDGPRWSERTTVNDAIAGWKHIGPAGRSPWAPGSPSGNPSLRVIRRPDPTTDLRIAGATDAPAPPSTPVA